VKSIRSIRIEEPENSGGGTTMRREVRVTIGSPADIVQARQQGRELALLAGFSVCDSTLITTAISEMSRNILEYAHQGEVTISLLKNGIKSGVKIVVSDQGPGIADISQVMQDGYSSRKGMGIGLPGTKRLMDEFEIRSKIGTGTTVTMKKWNRWKK
jgi:serine/threonine-protein kinase RsbT